MYLSIESKTYEVLAHAESEREFGYVCHVMDFLQNQCNTGAAGASAKGFKGLFLRYAEAGTSNLTTDIFHEANKEEKIFQFIKGALRVFCFKDGNKLILTHGAIKKGQKADTQEVARAVSVKKAYFQMKGSSKS